MFVFKKVDETYLSQYDLIPQRVNVTSFYKIKKCNQGIDGFSLVETPIELYTKDFCIGNNKSVLSWKKRFNISNWVFFMAFNENYPIGAATVASRTEGMNMLSSRDDLAVLWDIRIADMYKRQGIGQKLFNMAVEWARSQKMVQIKIECQNNNVPAIKFYHKQGATLGMIDEYAYYNEPECRHETQLIWYLDL